MSMALHWSTPAAGTTTTFMGDGANAIHTEEDLRCAYASKTCFTMRTTKKGGGLHRFCEFHRWRANKNQWRVDDKRRAVRAERRQQLKRLRGLALPDPIGLLDASPALTRDDIQLLQVLLLDSERSSRRSVEESSARSDDENQCVQ